MNKKIFIPVFIVLGLAMVTAIGYYTLYSTTFNVVPAITIAGETEFTIDTPFYSGDTFVGTPLDVSNGAAEERMIVVSDDSGNDVDVTYLGSVELSQKVVDFAQDSWTVRDDGLKASVEYVMVGNSFTATVTGFDTYSLVYYKDNSDRFNSPAQAILVEDVVGDLPYTDDKNTDEYNYCDTGEYTTCNGAKIWLVPTDALTGNDLDWSRADEFLFETSLVQFNSAGDITVYGTDTISVTPVYQIGDHTVGDYTITTTIA